MSRLRAFAGRLDLVLDAIGKLVLLVDSVLFHGLLPSTQSATSPPAGTFEPGPVHGASGLPLSDDPGDRLPSPGGSLGRH